MYKLYPLVVVMLLGVISVGCSNARTTPVVGNSYGEIPPRLVVLRNKNSTEKYNALTWRNMGSFGPVPSELQALGDASCQRVSVNRMNGNRKIVDRAIGYHPKAQNTKGQTLSQGGFYCGGRSYIAIAE